MVSHETPEAIVEEIIAKRTRKRGGRTKRNSYSRVQSFREKYIGQPRTRGKHSVRMLSTLECTQFRAHIELCKTALKPKSLLLPPPIGLPD
jgi:hypothetical protein